MVLTPFQELTIPHMIVVLQVQYAQIKNTNNQIVNNLRGLTTSRYLVFVSLDNSNLKLIRSHLHNLAQYKRKNLEAFGYIHRQC